MQTATGRSDKGMKIPRWSPQNHLEDNSLVLRTAELSLGHVKTKGPTTRERTGPSRSLGWRSARVGRGAGEEGGAFPAGRPGCSGNDQKAGLALKLRLQPQPQPWLPFC